MILELMACMLHAVSPLEIPKPGSSTKCMLLSFSYLLYHRRIKSPLWSMFVTDPALFNEDVCESSLSSLARSSAGKPNLRNIDATNKVFKRLQILHTTSTGLQDETTNAELGGPFKSAWSVPSGCAEVRHTITFVERLVHAIETNKCVQYDVKKSFVYAVDATTQVWNVLPRFKEFNFFQLVAENLSKFKKQQLVPYITTDPENTGLMPRL